MSDFLNRAVSAAFVVAVILFTGYMCGAPIIEPSFDNTITYFIALLFGAVMFVRPWRYGP